MAEDFERLARTAEQLAAERAAALDNGMTDPAPTDVAEAQEAEAPTLADDEKLAVLNTCVTKHPLNREIFYKTLRYCAEERPLRDVEEQIATFPEFPRATMNQYYLVKSLVESYGLELVERTADGERVTPAMKQGKTEDEIDDLVFSFNYRITPIGERLVAEHAPGARLESLLEREPARRGAYLQLLDYIAQEPRTYPQIEDLLKGNPALQATIDGHLETVQPSVLLDKLERAGVLVWNNDWQITEEGHRYLVGTND